MRHCRRYSRLFQSISKVQDENGWSGPVDIVSHSMGTCIVRYLLEVIDGTEHSQKVRQLIGLDLPNNGSALAELFLLSETWRRDH
jgi:triacylglycerol esterase/lipase EstA (alpha/beta hydrolase family)